MVGKDGTKKPKDAHSGTKKKKVESGRKRQCKVGQKSIQVKKEEQCCTRKNKVEQGKSQKE